MNFPHSRPAAGFSLVEMLVVIAIIGIMASVAFPYLSRAIPNMAYVSAKRNAQTLASINEAAAVAGIDFIDPDGDLADTVSAISTGAEVSEGVLAGEWFGCRLTDYEQQRALEFLEIQDGRLVYVSAD